MKKALLLFTLPILMFLSCASVDQQKYTDSGKPVDERVSYLLSIMTLEEKLGQMTQVNTSDLIDLEDITRYHLGSLLSGGGVGPRTDDPADWADYYDNFQSYALNTRLGIPLIYGVDAVHGHNNVYGATIFPHNIGLGATRDPELVEEIARITAMEVSGTGMDWTFAPCVAVPQDERWGRTYEGFGEDPELVTELGKAAIRGYQGDDLSASTTILATAKHYVADGGTEDGKDQGNSIMDEEELREIHLPPYIGAIEENVGSIMASFNSWNGDKLHGNQYLMTDVLKEELGFEGFIVSDWAGVKQLKGNYDQQIVTAINAGIDMVMCPADYIPFLDSLTRSVKSGKISMERIDESVGKILTAKFELGLFENPLTDRSLTPLIGSQEHRDVAREAVRKSLVLLKNENSLLPLDKNLEKILVSGSNANNLGAQCGGWTLTWQGERGNDLTVGTPVLEAIEQSVSGNSTIIFSQKGDLSDGSENVAIVVIGEQAYAEGKGDRKTLDLTPNDLETIRKIKESGTKIVTVLISGRPMIINEALELSDAFLAAWLPGTEGLGVADVLFGDYAPTGKLSHTWPASMDQIPLSADSEHAGEALFPYGFGLTY
ncbi:MAG: glycoside hydrolase family 3 C-terminal domain-containing protein [Spirochaetales bacterium]|nr:glycoside hydrolase family 3 C-terminal domain-containing protein [Spirochaetales bacterium]